MLCFLHWLLYTMSQDAFVDTIQTSELFKSWSLERHDCSWYSVKECVWFIFCGCAGILCVCVIYWNDVPEMILSVCSFFRITGFVFKDTSAVMLSLTLLCCIFYTMLLHVCFWGGIFMFWPFCSSLPKSLLPLTGICCRWAFSHNLMSSLISTFSCVSLHWSWKNTQWPL